MDKSGLSYPCRFPVKVFLKPDEGTEAGVVARVRAELTADDELELRRSRSSSGGYVCLTLTFTATDADQVSRVAAAVRDAPGVLLSV